jgi:hypothetical protein
MPWERSLLADGVHVFRAVARDYAGNRSVSEGVEARIDNTAPTLSLVATPQVIWPPNKKLVLVSIGVTAVDSMDPSPSIRLESATCDDGCAPNSDIVGASLETDDRQVAVRATRKGPGTGRTYSFIYRATDSAGNIARSTVHVRVPHDQK